MNLLATRLPLPDVPGLDLPPLYLDAPWALVLLLVPAAAAAALWAGARARRRTAQAFGGRPTTRPAYLRGALLVLGLAALALALARPQWGESEQPLSRRGVDVVVVLDVSRSMLAEDLEPNRATAAARQLTALVEHLRGDRVGLVTFAGTAFERSPLTLDLAAIRLLLERAQAEASLVRTGTSLESGVETALRVLAVDEPALAQAIVLVTDGEDLDDERLDEALRRARDRGVRVYPVAAATGEGAIVPGQPNAPPTRLDRPRLERVAAATGGHVRSVEDLPGLALEFRRMAQTAFDETTERALVDRFPWFLGAGLGLLLLATLAPPLPVAPGRRRSAAILGAGGLLLVACGGSALWRAVDAGNEAYSVGEYEMALAAYEDAAEVAPDDPAVRYNLGYALHQLERYEEATGAADRGLDVVEDPGLATLLHYSAGAHAFRRERLEAAREHYISALRIEPQDLDAKANLELVLRTLEPDEPSEEPAPAGEQPGSDGTDEGGDEPGPAPEGQVPAPPLDGDDDGAQPGATATPSPGQAGDPPGSGDADGTPGPGNEASPGDASTPDDLQDARARLEAAIAQLGQEVTLQDALDLLDLVREVNALESLPEGSGAGGINDR